MSNPDRFTFCKFPDAATGLCATDWGLFWDANYHFIPGDYKKPFLFV